ncbi:hypothetical protein WR25_11103 [Diploscapter pachys]|uniref:V-type proton ATPase subunit S1/VOA1 transmembrane domain-containing protein n=1 Tax=Diploscapter pachys TaxID=2018661 RepID=A0A2A2L7B2_9BILA|nr:hypothetical protein WR25_11103 [Diploscapter pachys]
MLDAVKTIHGIDTGIDYDRQAIGVLSIRMSHWQVHLLLASFCVFSVLGQNSDGTTMSGGTTASAGGKYQSLPLHIPPFNVSDYSDINNDEQCMLYMEGLSIVVMNNVDKNNLKFAQINVRPGDATWDYAKDDVLCPTNFTLSPYKFTIRLNITRDLTGNSTDDNTTPVIQIKSGTTFSFTISLNTTLDLFWKLGEATIGSDPLKVQGLKDPFTASGDLIAKSRVFSLENAGINGVYGRGWACSLTQAFWFNTGNDHDFIGIMFYNTQIQLTGINSTADANCKGCHYFMQEVDDCVGTFSPGSWMGIISALVMVAGLMFGYVMLQSVQTIDLFDDPKHKQIVINVRE